MYEKELQSIGHLLEIMDRLRVECPWDRKQTFESLRNNTIEETFELVDAISEGDMQSIREELGDLLLHVVFYSKMGSEQNAFNISDVADGICEKLIYRHPHVFGTTEARTAEKVAQNWEQLKLKEHRHERRGVLAGVPHSLPAMVKAYRVGQKAASAGFDWQQKQDVWAKVKEEIAEVEAEMTSADSPEGMARMEAEMGDLFFALINASRLYGIDPEGALEHTNMKFIRRFEHIEECCGSQGKSLRECSLDELEGYWQEAKQIERTPQQDEQK